MGIGCLLRGGFILRILRYVYVRNISIRVHVEAGASNAFAVYRSRSSTVDCEYAACSELKSEVLTNAHSLCEDR